MFAPALAIGFNISVDLGFEDFDQIENHPMMSPFLINFKSLFESMLHTTYQEVESYTEMANPGYTGSDGDKQTAQQAAFLVFDMFRDLFSNSAAD